MPHLEPQIRLQMQPSIRATRSSRQPRAVSCALFAFILVALGAPSSAQSILILDDTPATSEILAAATRVTDDVVETRTISTFSSSFASRERWDLLVVDVARSVFTPQLISVVDEHLVGGGALVIAHGNLDGNEPLRELLDLRCGGPQPTPEVYPSPGAEFDVFDLASTVPAPLVGELRHADNGDYCLPEGEGRTLARAEAINGQPLVVSTRNDQVIYSGLVFDSLHDTETPDRDEDEIPDVEEFIENLIHAALLLQIEDILVFGDAAGVALDRLAFERDFDVIRAETLAELDERLSRDTYRAVFIAFNDAESAPPGLELRLDALAGNTPVVFLSPSLDTSPRWQTYFGLTAIDDGAQLGLAGGITARSSVAFTYPFRLETLAPAPNPERGAAASLVPGTGWHSLARFVTGQPALVAADDGSVAVGTFALDALDRVDSDGDGLSDTSAFVLNVLQALRGSANGAPLLLVSDATEAGVPSPMYDAAWRSGYYPVPARSESVVAATLEQDQPDLVVFEDLNPAGLDLESTEILDALDAWASLSRSVVYVGPHLPGSPAMAALLELSAVGLEIEPTIVRDPSHLGRIFDLPSPTPPYLGSVPEACDPCVTSLTPTLYGAVAGRTEDGTPILATSRSGQVIALGINPYSVGQSDSNADRRMDRVQLLQGMLHYAATPPQLLALADVPLSSTIEQAAYRVGLSPTHTSDPATWRNARGDSTVALLVDAGVDDYLLDDSTLSALTDAMDAGISAIVADPRLDTAEKFEALQISAAATLAERLPIVELRDSTASVFRIPFDVPSPLWRNESATSPDGITFSEDAGTAPLARYGTNVGPIAVASARSGRLTAAGFTLSDVVDTDLDGDGIEDNVAFLANLLARQDRIPHPSITAPSEATERELVALDASATVDPLRGNLEFAWDLDADGLFDDAAGPFADLDAGLFDGPTIATVAVRATNSIGLSGVAYRDITISNAPPLIDPGGDRVLDQGTPLTYEVIVEDAPGETFLVHWDFGDGESSVQTSGSHSYDALGTYEVGVAVADDDSGVSEARFTVEYVNVPPTVTITAPAEIDEGDVADFSVSVDDPGGDDFLINWDFGDESGGGGFNASKRYGVPGTYAVTVEATDEHGGTGADTVAVVVNNVPPQITSTPPADAVLGGTVTYVAQAQDPGSQPLTWTLHGAPPGMAISASGVVEWDVPPTRSLAYEVLIRVEDASGARDEQAWTLALVAVDGDGGGAPDACEEFYGADASDAGDDTLDLDGDGLTLAQECAVGSDPGVFSGPSAPEPLSPIDGDTWRQEELELAWANSTDPDDDAVTYDVQLFDDPSLLELLAESLGVPEGGAGVSTADFTPDFVEDQRYFWRVRGVTDDVTGPWSETQNFVFNNLNRPPGSPTILSPVEFGGENPPTLRVGNATDPDGERLTYDFELFRGDSTRESQRLWRTSDVPEGAGGETFVTLTSPLADRATYTWRARARDATGGVGAFAFSTFVLDVSNRPPPEPELQYPIGDIEVRSDRPVVFEWEGAPDPDGDRITYVGDIAADGDFTAPERSFRVERSLLDSTSVFDTSTPLTADTSYVWRVAADDGRFRSEYVEGTFRVGPPRSNAVPTAPRPVSPLAGMEIESGEDVELIVDNATDADGDPLTYQFEVALDVTMRQQINSFTDVAEGPGSTSVALGELPALRYFWRARATDGRSAGAWSTVIGFDVVSDQDSDADAGVLDGSGSDAGTDIAPRPTATRGQLGGGGGCAASQPAPGTGSGPLSFIILMALVVVRRHKRGA